jgi:hypothetical protein
MQFHRFWTFGCPGYADRAAPWPQHVAVDVWWPPRTRIVDNTCPSSFDSFLSFANFPLAHAIIAILKCYRHAIPLVSTPSYRTNSFTDHCYSSIHSINGADVLNVSQCCHSWMDNENHACRPICTSINFLTAAFWGNLIYYFHLYFSSLPGQYWSLYWSLYNTSLLLFLSWIRNVSVASHNTPLHSYYQCYHRKSQFNCQHSCFLFGRSRTLFYRDWISTTWVHSSIRTAGCIL